MPKSQTQPPAKESKGSFLKGIGAVAAVVSLLLALNQVTGLVQNLRVHHKEFSDAMKSGEQEQARKNYSAAFHSFKRATELDPIDHVAQAKETQAAMLWLESPHENEQQKQTFADVANQTLPVLDSALVKAKGQDAGDILSHIACANFLKYRDNIFEGVDVDGNLQAALAADPNNVYAHAMSGHWILWRGDDIKSAETHFNAALATGRVHDYVRNMQLVALINRDNLKSDVEKLRVSDEMRKANETMSPEIKHKIFLDVFTSHLYDRESLNAVLAAIPPPDVETTYDWLDDTENGEGKTWNRAFVTAKLKEVTGNSTEALAAYQDLQKNRKRGVNDSLHAVLDTDIKRLSHSH